MTHLVIILFKNMVLTSFLPSPTPKAPCSQAKYRKRLLITPPPGAPPPVIGLSTVMVISPPSSRVYKPLQLALK